MLVMEAERFGGPQVLTARQVPDPVAGPGRAVVRTSAADVDYSEPGWAGQVRELTAADARRPGVQARRGQDPAAPLIAPRVPGRSRAPPITASTRPSPLRPTPSRRIC